MQKVMLRKMLWSLIYLLLGIRERSNWNTNMLWLSDRSLYCQKYVWMWGKILMEARGWLLRRSFQNYTPLWPNSNITDESMTEIIDIYWKEYCDFNEKLVFLPIDPVFLTPLMQLKVVLDFWHELYSHPFMRVLGYVACRTTSKQLVVGSAEWSWSDLKQIKDGERSNPGGALMEKWAFCKLNEAVIKCSHDLQ